MSHDRLMRWVHRLAMRSGLIRLVDFYLAGLNAERKLNAGSRLLFGIRHSAWYPLLVGGLAVISAATSLYPFGPIIVAATVFAPNRWRGVIVGAALGAVIGASAFALLVQSYGVGLVDRFFPLLRESAIWEHSAYWINHHGSLALAAIAALPVPQMPAMILAALSEMGLLSIALALLVGKTLKYTVYVLGVLLVLRAIRHVASWQEPEA
jgi:membrane protein YqaA with SNARE-associated domain